MLEFLIVHTSHLFKHFYFYCGSQNKHDSVSRSTTVLWKPNSRGKDCLILCVFCAGNIFGIPAFLFLIFEHFRFSCLV